MMDSADFTHQRRRLFGIAYRMLGSVSEAEDMVQEVWLRWQKQDPDAINAPQAWLVSTMTRLCIDQLRSARRARESYYGVWLPEPLMAGATGPGPDEAAGLADSLSMAFMLMLETLDPVERAVFLLREVFQHDYAETAAIVGKSEANCRQIIRRAKEQLRGQTEPPPPTEQAHQLVEQFLAAAESGQMQELLKLLTEDATVYSDGGGKVRAAGRPIQSADHVSRFFIGILPRLPGDTEWRPATVNGRTGVLLYSGSEVFGACSFDFVGHRIQNFFLVLNPDKLRHLTTG